MKKSLLLATAFVLSTLFSPAGPAKATDRVAEGKRIATEWDMRDTGFGDTRAYMKMELVNRHGQKSVRKMRTDSFEIASHDEGDKSLVLFEHPRDVKGTAFLSFSHTSRSNNARPAPIPLT